MPLQNFVANQLPTIKAAWLNIVDVLTTSVFASASTAAQARTAIDVTSATTMAGSTGASLVGFLQSGTGAVARNVQLALAAAARSGDFDTSGHFDAAVSALTESFGVAKFFVGTATTADAGGFAVRAAGATVASGLIGQSLGITVNGRFEPAAVGSTLNQFGTIFQITGGSGAQTISRVALQAAAQTGGGGSNQPIAANFVVQQNAADTQTSMVGLEIDVANNKVSDDLDPAPSLAHYGLSIVSGGSKIVGPAAIMISASTPATDGWRRGIYIPTTTIVPNGYAFDYAGNVGGASDFKVRDDGRVMVGTATVGIGTGTNYMLSLDCSAQAGAILSGSAAGNGMLSLWNRATVGDNTFALFFTEGGIGTLRGSITYNRGGGLVAFNTTSDARLKRNVRKLEINAKKILHGCPPVTFDWKTGGIGHGYIGQKLYRFFPMAVTKGHGKGKKRIPWQVDLSKMVPALHARIIEQDGEIADLKKRLARLEKMMLP